MMQALCDSHRCVVMDFRGSGESGKDAADYRIQTLADDVIGLIDELALNDFILIGHSMGGKVARLVAARYPKD